MARRFTQFTTSRTSQEPRPMHTQLRGRVPGRTYHLSVPRCSPLPFLSARHLGLVALMEPPLRGTSAPENRLYAADPTRMSS